MATILLVEDEPLVRMGFTKLLEADGHAVQASATCASAMTLARAGGQDLILMDVGLPDVDGIECARQLREAKVRTPIVFLTAYGDDAFVERAIEQQAYAYLVKPITGAQLLPVVRTALAAVRATQDREDRMTGAIVDSREVSAAVGMLAERHGWDIDHAFEVLRMRARSESRRIVDVAMEITRRKPER